MPSRPFSPFQKLLKLRPKKYILFFSLIVADQSNLFTASAQTGSDYWLSAGGPVGGDISAIAGAPSAGLFAAHGDLGSLYRSLDGGFHWSRVASFGGGISSMFVPEDGSLLVGARGILARSTDGGQTWTHANLGPGANDIFAFAEDPSNLVYAASSRGILVSTDHGTSWQTSAGAGANTFAKFLAVDNSHNLYAVTDTSVIVSADSGRMWTSIGFPKPGQGVSAFLIDCDGRPFCGVPWMGFFRLQSNPQLWIKVSGLSTFNAFLTKDSIGTIYLGADDDLYRSTDAGATWSSCGLRKNWVHSVYVGSPNQVIAGVYEIGIACSNAGTQNWSVANLTSTTVLSLILAGSDLVTIEEYFGILISTDAGGSWHKSNLSGFGVSSLLKVNDRTLFATKGYSGVYRSDDGGVSWSGAGLADVMNARAMTCKKGGTIYVGGYNARFSLYRSTNNGVNWEETEFSIPNNSNINVLSVAPDGSVLVGTQLFGVYRSLDGMSNWQQSGLEFQGVNCFVVSAARLVYAGTEYHGIYRSTDDGKTWLNVLPLKNVVSLATDSSGHVFAGIFEEGVMVSADSGSTWHETGTGLKGRWVNCLTAASDGYLYAGTDDGLYRSQSKTTYMQKDIHNYPVQFSIGQNYPNPFNPSTTIEFDLPSQAFVSLKVFDILGREVATLVSQMKHAGSHSVRFDGSGPPRTQERYRLIYKKRVNIMSMLRSTLFAGLLALLFSGTAHAQWQTNGPYGGYAHCFAVSGTNLFAGTLGSGVRRRPLSEMITSVPAEGGSTDLPTHVKLDQNYPNPFNPLTASSFRLPSKSFVSLKVFEALAREVSILLSEELPAGKYSRRWNAAGLPSGMYFYRLRAGAFTDTKKLLLVR